MQNLIGQERVKKVLQGIYKTGNIANGYIFAGPEKCGKTTAAREFVNLINNQTINPVDFYELNFQNSIKIEQIRELKKYVQYGPYESKFLTVIIPQADKMTMEAANSFLKLLEEPPAGVFFILETAFLNQVPKTILSRCQTIYFSQLNQVSLSKIILSKYPDIAPAELKNITLLSGGMLPLAEIFIQEKEIINNLINNLDQIKQKSLNELINLADNLAGQKEKLMDFFSILGQHFRNKLQLTRANTILEYQKVLQKNVNLKLALTAFLLSFQEVA